MGPVVVARGTTAIPSHSALLRTFVALLALAPGRPVPVDVIVDELWGEMLPREPRPAVQALVSRLRRWLAHAGAGPDAIRFENDGYVLDLTADQVDLHRFVHSAESVLGLSPADPVDVVERCEEALAQCQGEPFEGCQFGPRLEGARVRVTELSLAVAERRCAALIELGRYGPAIAELRALLAENPTREQLAASAMIALYRAGRQREALALYQETRRILVESFGLEPSRALSRLEAQLLRQDPEVAGPLAPADRSTVRPVARPLIVGREKELAAIADARQAAQGSVVVITGEAGSGKTTLLQAALADAIHGGATAGLASFEGGDAPLAAWREGLRQIGVILPAAGALPEGTTLGKWLHSALARAATSTPVVLGLEDLHRADSASLGLLLALARPGVPDRVTLLVSAREPDVGPHQAWLATLAELARLPCVSRVHLGMLDADQVHDLVWLRLRHLGAAAAERLSALLHDRSAGHPLHLSALLDSMVALPDEPTCREAAARVPDRLLPLIRYYLASLPQDSRDAVETLSVIGRVGVGVLAEVLGSTAMVTLRTLRPAIELGLVSDDDGVLRLRHALTEQVVVESTPATTRNQLHLEVLERLPEETDAFVVLRHASGAGPLVDRGRLGKAQLAAAVEAYGQGAFDEALSLAAAARDNLDERESLEAELRAGLSLAALGRIGEADAALDEVLRRAGPRSDLALVAAVGHEPLGLRVRGDGRRLARLREVFAAGTQTPTTARLDLLRALILEETLVYGKLRTTAARSELAELACQLDSEDDRARLAFLEAREMLEEPVPAVVRLQAAERAYECAVRTDDPVLRLNSLELLASAALAAADPERCEDVLWELSRTAERCGRPRSRWVARILRAALLLAAGDSGADEAAQEAMSLGLSLGIPDAVGAHGVHQLARELLAGDVSPILPLVDMAVAMYPKVPAWRAAGSLASSHAGDSDVARQRLQEFLTLRRETSRQLFDRSGLCLAAWAALELGDSSAAGEILRALPPDRGVVVVGVGAAVLGPVNLYVGLAQLAAGDVSGAGEHLAEGAVLARQLGWTPWAEACTRSMPGLAENGSVDGTVPVSLAGGTSVAVPPAE